MNMMASDSHADAIFFSEHSRPADRQCGQEPLALARLRPQCSQNTGSRALRALSGSTLPRWRGAQGATGTAPSQWLLLRNHRKSFVIAGLVLARSTDTMPASIYLYATETDEFASVRSDRLSTHTRTHAERLFVLIIHKQSLNLNSLLTSAAPASLWSHNESPMIQSLHLHSRSSFHSFHS